MDKMEGDDQRNNCVVLGKAMNINKDGSIWQALVPAVTKSWTYLMAAN